MVRSNLETGTPKATRVMMIAPTIWKRDYPVRPQSFGMSVIAHVMLLGTLWVLPDLPAARPKRTVLEEFKPQPGRRLIWYQFKKELPAVKPLQQIGQSAEPRGAIRTLQQPIVAASPRPASREQFVWHEAPKIEVREDLKAPNIVVPARPVPRAFRAPAPARKQPEVPALSGLPTELLKTTDTPSLTATTGVLTHVDRPRKAFVAPASQGSPQGTGTIALDVDSAPVPGVNDASGSVASLAIVGLRPADKLEGPPPEGSRGGAFSRALSVGPPSSGAGTGSGLPVPDLMIGAGKNPGGAVSGSKKPGAIGQPAPAEIIYNETYTGGSRTALSIPLRPGIRKIPPAIEARFRERLLYTIVIPMPRLPSYTGDWVVWFGEAQAASSGLPRMQAPVPVRKVDTLATGRMVEGAVRIAASIRKDGRLERIEVLSGDPVLAGLGVEDLKKWDFLPAYRDGATVDVDVVFEIPLRLPVPQPQTQ